MENRWFTDHPPSTRFPHYTRANAGEVLPTPASPLGQTFGFDTAILLGFQEGSTTMGMYEDADYRDGEPDMCGFFGGYFYVNLSCVRMQAVRNPAITVEQLDLAIFGDQPNTPAYAPHPDDEKPHLQPIADAHMQFVLTATAWPEIMEEREQSLVVRSARPNLEAARDAELLARIREVHPVMRVLARNQMVAAGSSGIAPGMLAAAAEAVGDPSIPMRLLAGLGDVESAAPSFALWDISRLVAGSEELTAAFDAGVEGVLDQVHASTSDDAKAFAAAWETFIYDFGSRGPNEWELSAHTWETDPTIALAAVDRIRFQGDDKSPTAGGQRLAAERETLLVEVRAKLANLNDPDLTGMFEGALVGGNMMAFRERCKTTLVRVLHEARVAMRELGRRHAQAGNLADPEHIFMITNDELDGFVAQPTGHAERLSALAQDWAKLWDLEPPFFISDGQIPPLSEWASKGGAAVASTIAAGEVLAGVPGSPGVVQGTARIVLDPANPPDLMPGDIMVAPLTDPAWTPLFMAADGVVVNVGGQISHAVIVSRELGLPCVVSVANATTQIPDGATIEVDGAAGQVRIITLP